MRKPMTNETKNKISIANSTHRLSNTGIYNTWSNMKARCDDKNRKDYANYGGRGISYNKKWTSFDNFYNDMNHGWRIGLSLDRINNNKGYSKENCRWADRFTQNNNRRNIVKFENKSMAQWARELNINASTIKQRYFVYNWDIEKAILTPIRKRG